MTGARAVLALIVICVSAAGCGPAMTPAQAPGGGAAGAPALPADIRWVQDSAEYRAILRQTYRLASMTIGEAVSDRPAGTWGVVLDADETVISNVAYQRERAAQGLGYTPESWTAWVRRREAMPLPGAPEFLTRVRALGGRIAIVTNRLQSECDDTEAVLRQHQLAYDAIFCRPDGAPSDKNPRFAQAATTLATAGAPPVEIVAFIGDNIHDFPNLSQALAGADGPAFADFGSRFFVIPNPMYGSWQ